MKPIKFKGHNVVLAEKQKEYQPLPVFRAEDKEGTVVSCWKLTWRERWKLLWTGQLWLSQLTFHSPLQPQLPSVDKLVITADDVISELGLPKPVEHITKEGVRDLRYLYEHRKLLNYYFVKDYSTMNRSWKAGDQYMAYQNDFSLLIDLLEKKVISHINQRQ